MALAAVEVRLMQAEGVHATEEEVEAGVHLTGVMEEVVVPPSVSTVEVGPDELKRVVMAELLPLEGEAGERY